MSDIREDPNGEVPPGVRERRSGKWGGAGDGGEEGEEDAWGRKPPFWRRSYRRGRVWLLRRAGRPQPLAGQGLFCVAPGDFIRSRALSSHTLFDYPRPLRPLQGADRSLRRRKTRKRTGNLELASTSKGEKVILFVSLLCLLECTNSLRSCDISRYFHLTGGVHLLLHCLPRLWTISADSIWAFTFQMKLSLRSRNGKRKTMPILG